MNNLKNYHRTSSGRRRLAELRTSKRDSVADSINRSLATVIVNLIIELASACLFIVGLVVIAKIMGINRSEMDPMMFRMYVGIISMVVLIWAALLFRRVRRKIVFLRDAFGKKQEPPAGD